MLFLPIREIEIFDQVPNRIGMSFSLRVDAEAVCGCQIADFERLSSGADTMGAFTDENKQTIVAWIDPVDGRFVSLKPSWGFTPAGTVVLTILCGICILIFLNMLLQGTGFGSRAVWGASIVASLAGMAIAGAVMHHFRLPSRLELALRQHWENHRAGRSQAAPK